MLKECQSAKKEGEAVVVGVGQESEEGHERDAGLQNAEGGGR